MPATKKGWTHIHADAGWTYTSHALLQKKVEEEVSFSDDDEIFDPTITHTVLKGETVKSIAQKYDLGIDVLQLLNSEEKLKSVKVGDEIIIGYAHDMEEKKEFLKGNISILKHEHEH